MSKRPQRKKPSARARRRTSVAEAPAMPHESPESIELSTESAPPPVPHDDDASDGEQPPRAPRLTLRDVVALGTGTADTLVFRVGRERFAIDLAAVDEAIELPEVHHLPEMPDHLLGVFELRGRLVPIYSPLRVLRVDLASHAAAVLVLRWRDRRIGVAVDDVDDVLAVDVAMVRRAPIPDNDDNVLLGVIRRGSDLLALVDAEALAQASLTDQLTETT